METLKTGDVLKSLLCSYIPVKPHGKGKILKLHCPRTTKCVHRTSYRAMTGPRKEKQRDSVHTFGWLKHPQSSCWDLRTNRTACGALEDSRRQRLRHVKCRELPEWRENSVQNKIFYRVVLAETRHGPELASTTGETERFQRTLESITCLIHFLFPYKRHPSPLQGNKSSHSHINKIKVKYFADAQ